MMSLSDMLMILLCASIAMAEGNPADTLAKMHLGVPAGGNNAPQIEKFSQSDSNFTNREIPVWDNSEILSRVCQRRLRNKMVLQGEQEII